MRNPFTFFPIQELGSPEGYNFENAKWGDMSTFKTVCGGEGVDFICHLNFKAEIIYTVKNNLVCFFKINSLKYIQKKFIKILTKGKC